MHIMTKVLVVCSVALFFATTDCWAFRCGSGLVSSGDTKTQVLVTCGKPISKEELAKGCIYGTTTAAMVISFTPLHLKITF